MDKKIVTLSAILLISMTVSACTKSASNSNTNTFSAAEIVTGVADVKIKEKADKDMAVAKAKELWRIQFQLEEDLSKGPCLSNDLIPDWVADIAHNPRQAVDDEPVNQCPAYVAGMAHHFVELDPEGNLIRAE
ncbi:MAG: hypothetical protein V1668_02585 [Patescibacteria group bacterium]